MSDKDRKIISWRLERLSERERATINQWADKQDNIQQSLTTIILHAIKRFGIETDVMEFDVQQAMHAESLGAVTIKPQPVTKVTPPPAAATYVQETTQPVVTEQLVVTTPVDTPKETQKEVANDTQINTPTVTQKEITGTTENEPVKEVSNGSEKSSIYNDAATMFNED